MKPQKNQTPGNPQTYSDRPTANFTHKAVTTFKNPEDGFWYLVEVDVDPRTKQVGQLTLKNTDALDRGTAQEAFKIRAANIVECFTPN